MSYNFLHLSTQELLAGFYMATELPAEEQVTKFNKLFTNPHFSAMLHFYMLQSLII